MARRCSADCVVCAQSRVGRQDVRLIVVLVGGDSLQLTVGNASKC